MTDEKLFEEIEGFLKRIDFLILQEPWYRESKTEAELADLIFKIGRRLKCR